MIIPRKDYCLVHLKYIETATGVPDWFSFLDSEDRLARVMDVSIPLVLDKQVSEHNQVKDFFGWAEIYDLVGRNIYGLWPNPTPLELWVDNLIEEINETWYRLGCYENSEGDEARRLKAEYAHLKQLCASKQYF